MRHLTSLSLVLLALAAGVACGSSASSDNGPPPGNDGGPGNPGNDSGTPPGTDAPAPPPIDAGAPPPFPTLETSSGPVLASPKIIPVFFPGYDLRQQVGDFVTKFTGSEGADIWRAETSEYGVGALSMGNPVDLTEQAPTGPYDDSAIQTWLQGKLDGTHAEFGTPTTETIYTIFYPSQTKVTLGNGQAKSCAGGFGGYHQTIQVTVNGSPVIVPYAVIPECGTYGPLNGIDDPTGTVSHEWAEAATDPQPLGISTPLGPGQGQAAYNKLDDKSYAWRALFGGVENGDMCAQSDQSFTKPAALGYTFQRTWSNQAWMAGKDPCAPAIDTPYFVAYPMTTDMVSVLDVLTFSQIQTPGFIIPVNGSKTINVPFWANGATGPFKVAALDGSLLRGGTSASLTFKWDQQTCETNDAGVQVCFAQGNPGDVHQLTVTVQKAGNPGLGQPTTFLLESEILTPGGGRLRNFWPAIVTNM
jgi:hypothetical protein